MTKRVHDNDDDPRSRVLDTYHAPGSGLSTSQALALSIFAATPQDRFYYVSMSYGLNYVLPKFIC